MFKKKIIQGLFCLNDDSVQEFKMFFFPKSLLTSLELKSSYKFEYTHHFYVHLMTDTSWQIIVIFKTKITTQISWLIQLAKNMCMMMRL